MNPDGNFYNLEILSTVACELWEKQRQEKLQQHISERQRQEELLQLKRQRQQEFPGSLMYYQETKKMKKESSPVQHQSTPHWLLHFIHFKRASQPVFLFSKVLTKSDVDKRQARLLLNHQAADRMAAQLNGNEMSLVNADKLEVMVIDRQGRVHSMGYKKYDSGVHRFFSGWVELCDCLGLKPCVHSVHLWSFRVEVDTEDGEDGEEMKKSQFWLAIESTSA
ncbi:DNA-binding pseudobarrel domain-containing protein [Dioscorea alata]|uniref:DNA-binding pseudobarrel domain-containing protein n=1 Tax=Dioscorea alata TaxID=55571 RepID=A0ACB7VLH1_DIOAL|nr:DNA-binding pseudobarrel domain-containing protein [Dioscorea alata]